MCAILHWCKVYIVKAAVLTRLEFKSLACVHKFRGFALVWYSNLILDSRNVLQT